MTIGQKARDALYAARKPGEPPLTPEQVAYIIDDAIRSFRRKKAQALPKETKAERNLHFDALAVGCGYKLTEIVNGAGRMIGTALADIQRATPEVTPDEISRRIREYKRRHRDWPCTPKAIASHWAELAPPDELARQLDPYLEPANWREKAAQMYPGIDFADRPWNDIGITIRADIVRRLPNT